MMSGSAASVRIIIELLFLAILIIWGSIIFIIIICSNVISRPQYNRLYTGRLGNHWIVRFLSIVGDTPPKVPV